MELKKPNDIFVATINNPMATTYDLMSSEINPENTSLYTKDEYKEFPFIKKMFTTEDGNFDNLSFDKFYDVAEGHYNRLTEVDYLNSLDQVWYSPFDITRPKEAKTFNVSVEYGKDFNPFKQTYGKTDVFSVDESNFSLRELAQRGKIFDTEKGEFLEESVNDRSVLGKLFGQTLVYAQWDEDGTHLDPVSNRMVKHSKGDWKVNNDGELFVETLGKREVYGKQVVNPMDALTTDGTLANSFDIFDADNKEANAIKTTLKIAAEIAPLFIPGVALPYGAVKAAIGLSSALPTLYKSLEGIILGEETSKLNHVATAAENYMAKFAATSTSDEAQGSLFNYEQISTMVADIFSQIYEQRAMASLSKLFYHPSKVKLSADQQRLISKVNETTFKKWGTGQIDEDEIKLIHSQLASKVPGLQEIQRKQSAMAKSFSLGYMALTSTASIYGEALEGGYDRRTAGFAGLLAATGTYALMMNNRMGDWFLDETTGYTVETNKALMRKGLKGYMEPIEAGIKASGTAQGKAKLAQAVKGWKSNISDMMTNTSVIGEALWKNAIIEGIEEVSEELVIDATKGVVDVMSHLGLTKKRGTFGGFQNVFSLSGLERYAASLMGGVLGGALFELNRSKPWLKNQEISFDARQSVYEMIGNGQTDLLINEVNKLRKNLGNKYIAPFVVEGKTTATDKEGYSHADVVADITIAMIKDIDGLMNKEGLILSDEELIDKAMADYLIIRDLAGTISEKDKLGIEGIIVEDFRKHAAALTELNAEIQKLSEDKEGNKEAIKQLQEKAEWHRSEVTDIKEGKRAQDYFDKINLYLQKDISKAFLAIDLASFTEARYNKEYHTLPESGLGITKELVKKEWESSKDIVNFRQNLDVAWNVYKDLEKKLNKPLFDYSESGYSEQRRKTFLNLLDIATNFKMFNVKDANAAKESVANWLKIQKMVETNTGIRSNPWDSLSIDAYDKFKEKGLIVDFTGNPLSDTYLDQELTEGEEKATRREIIQRVLKSTLSQLPTDNLDFNSIALMFNDTIKSYNDGLERKQEELLAEKTEENSNEIDQQIKDLESKKLIVALHYIQGDKKLDEKERQIAFFLNNEMVRLGLTPELVNGFSSDMLTWKLETHKNTLDKFAKTLKKDVSDLTNDELKEALKQYIEFFALTNPGDNSLIELIMSDSDSKLSQIEAIVDKIHSTFDIYKNNYSEYVKRESEITTEAEDFNVFEPINYTLDAILKEIKDSGNLDKELFNKLEEIYLKIISNFKGDFFKEITISNENLLDLIFNISTINQDFKDSIEDYKNDMGFWDTFPSYIMDILNTSENFDATMYALENELSEINKKVKQNKNTINKLKELKEVLDNKEKFIPNTIYEFLNNFLLSLDDEKEKRQKTIVDILRDENLTLFNASDPTNYIKAGFQEKDMLQAIDALKMLRSIVLGTSMTTVSSEDPIGFIEARKRFAEKHDTKSDITKLKTISSDIANLVILELQRIQNKLEFLVYLSRNNSGQIFLEEEEIRKKTNEQLLYAWKVVIKEKPDVPSFPDLSELIDSNLDDEKKLLEIEHLFFEHYNTYSKEDRIKVVKELARIFKFKNILYDLYDKDGSNRIDKNIKSISNNDFLLYLVTSLSVDSYDFNNRLVSILEKDSFDKSPFFTQEFSTKVIYASIIEPDLFSEIIIDTQSELAHLTDRITYILGDAGTGKTAVLFKIITLLLQNNNPNLNIWFSAPSLDKTNDLYDSVLSSIDHTLFTKEKFIKSALFKELGIDKILEQIYAEDFNNSEIVEIVEIAIPNSENKAEKIVIKDWNKINFDLTKTNLPDVLFIDEISHFDALELELLNEYSKRTNKLKIIGAGDYIQLGITNEKVENVSYNIDRVSGIFSPQLSLSVRAANSQQRENNDYLSALVKRSINIFSSAEDTPAIMDMIDNGILLKYHLSPEVLTGTLLSSTNLIPNDVLNTLRNIIKNKPETKIGVLSNNINELDPELEKQFEAFGITKANIKLFTEGNIQGSEVDYFILPNSFIKGRHVLDSLRRLYTYSTRSKQATIILNEGEITNPDTSIIRLKNEQQSSTVFVTPLQKNVIDEDKKKRIDKLKEILNPNFDIKYDFFKFSKSELDLTDEDDGDSEYTGETLTQEKFDPEFEKESFKYRLHTFYNDLDINITRKGGKVFVEKNPNSSFSYGLSFLYDIQPTDGFNEADFDNYVEEFVRLKYDIWKTSKSTGKNKFQPPVLNTVLKAIFGDTSKLQSTLVVKKSTYYKAYNTAFDKKLDKTSPLEDGDDYYNLMLKVSNGSKEYYVQLATFPLLNTVNTWFEKDKESRDKFENFINSIDDEVEIDPTKINVKTSTRLVKSDDNPVKYSLEELSKFKGLLFLDGTEYVKKPAIKIFPNTFEKFKQKYAEITFGEPISEEKLKELFYGKGTNSGYKGKPYVAVTFIKDKSHVQYVLLKSNTKTIKQIQETIRNPLGLKTPISARQLILSKRQDEVFPVTETLFNANQVLDMLVRMAVKQPQLFREFFKTGKQLIQESNKDLAGKNIKNNELLSLINEIVSKDLIENMTHKEKGQHSRLREVYLLIENELTIAEKSKTTLTEKNLKTKLVRKIQGYTDKKYWSTKFWNIFSFYDQMNHTLGLYEAEVGNYFDETIQVYKSQIKIIDQMLKFWSNEFNDKFYYNIPITKDGEGFKIKDVDSNLSNTFITLTPEGPYLNLDLSDNVIIAKKKDKKDKIDPEITKLITKLKSIKYSGEAIVKDEPGDTKERLNLKIKVATLIKDILEHKKNTEYTLQGLTDISNLSTLPGVSESTSFEEGMNIYISDLEQKLRSLNTEKTELTPEIVFDEITEIVNKNSSKPVEALLNNLKTIHQNFDELSEEDKLIFNQLISKWRNKVFNGKSLYEILNEFPKESSLLLDHYYNLTSKNSDHHTVQYDLTSYIFKTLGIDHSDSDSLDNLFINCQ